jgi:hypothetical protein
MQAEGPAPTKLLTAEIFEITPSGTPEQLVW